MSIVVSVELPTVPIVTHHREGFCRDVGCFLILYNQGRGDVVRNSPNSSSFIGTPYTKHPFVIKL